MPYITARKSLFLAATATAVLVLALLLLTGAASTRADAPVRDGDALTVPFSTRAALTVTPRDAADCGGGSPCVEVTDPASVAQPAGPCESQSADHLALRCPTANLKTVEISGSGDLPVAIRIDRPAGSACPAYALTLREGASNGAVAAADGCPQRIVCSQYYVGHVDADSHDVVDASCVTVSVDGTPTRTPGDQPACSTPYHGCAPDGGGGGRSGTMTTQTTDPTDPSRDGSGGAKGPAANPISSVRLARAGRRTLRSTVALSAAARVNVSLMRRTSRGTWVRVRSLGRDGRAGSTSVSLRRPDGKPFAAGLYRATAIAAVADAKLVTSKAVRVRR